MSMHESFVTTYKNFVDDLHIYDFAQKKCYIIESKIYFIFNDLNQYLIATKILISKDDVVFIIKISIITKTIAEREQLTRRVAPHVHLSV